MSEKWTNQQKLLHVVKVIGGASVVLPTIYFTAKWGCDRANILFEAVNNPKMGIDKANNILGMSNKLGPEVAEKLLSAAIAVADTCTHNGDNVIPFKRGA